MAALDTINQRAGDDTVRVAAFFIRSSTTFGYISSNATRKRFGRQLKIRPEMDCSEIAA